MIGGLGGTSADAVREATRDGAPAIDLIDGDLLGPLEEAVRVMGAVYE